MGFTVDFSEFDRMVKKYAQLERKFNQFLEDFLLRMAWEVIKEVKPKTPVGHDIEVDGVVVARGTGNLRNSWKIGEIKRSGKNLEVEILNTAEYATEVEYGHRGVFVPRLGVTLHTDTRWTDGRFMLTTTLDHVRKGMPQAFEKQFMDFYKKLGIN